MSERPVGLIEAELVDAVQDLAEAIREIAKLYTARAETFDKYASDIRTIGHIAGIPPTSVTLGWIESLNIAKMKESEFAMKVLRLTAEAVKAQP